MNVGVVFGRSSIYFYALCTQSGPYKVREAIILRIIKDKILVQCRKLDSLSVVIQNVNKTI